MFNKNYNFKNYLWIIPFLCFLLGYLTVQNIFQPKSFNTPSIVGKKLQEAIAILSKNQLNIKFILEKEDSDLPHGTILSQKPVPGLKITPNQSVYVTISKKPDRSACPELFNKNIGDVSQALKAKNLKNKNFYVPSDLPCNSCVAQYPLPEFSVKDTCIITYISKGNRKPVIFPNFKNKKLPVVLEFLKSHNLKAEIIYSNKQEISRRELKKQDAQILQEAQTQTNIAQTQEQKIIQEGQQAQEITKPTETGLTTNPEQTQVAQAQNGQDSQATQTQTQNQTLEQITLANQAAQVSQEVENTEDLTILDQRPLAGSLVILDPNKPITVHLKVFKK